MRDFIQNIVENLVDDLSAISVKEMSGESVNVIEVKVAKKDVGKVIGRSGKNAEAIRTIVNCAAAKLQKRYVLQIVDGAEIAE